MKPIAKFIFPLIVAMFINNTTKAQTTDFYITWEGCTLTSESSSYEVTYNVLQYPGFTPIINPTPTANTGHSQIKGVDLNPWNCNESTEKFYYYIYASVVLKDGSGQTYCSGTDFFGPLECEELFEGNYYNVVME
jgi:hypothetical protein